MSALLDSLACAFSGDPARAELLAQTVQTGLPHPRSEAWKYTSLRTLERRTFTPAPEAVADFDITLLDGIPAPRLVFVNGRFDAVHSDTRTLPAGVQFETAMPRFDARHLPETADAVFPRLNAALACTGILVNIPENTTLPAPLHLVNIGTDTGTDHAWHLRHRLEIARGAHVCLVEHHLASGAHRHLDNSVLELNLGEDSHLLHARIQAGSEGAAHVLATQGQLHARAHYTRVDIELGGGLVRHECNMELLGDGASLTANGVLHACARRHVETRLKIEHRARNTRCHLNWRGIASGRGRVVFHGGITIHPGADGSEAALSNKNLLLSEHAQIDTQPVLVIHADEVQATHGATVGQLDANALFYLRARGLPLAQARQLLTAAFIREPLLPLVGNPLHGTAQHRLDLALNALA